MNNCAETNNISKHNSDTPTNLETKTDNSLNILWVDDDELILETGVAWMNYLGHKIDTALSGKDAINLLTLKKYNLLITDFNMPMMDGLELLKKIKDQYSDMKRVLLTGNIDDTHLEKEKTKYNLHKISYKPFDEKTIKDLLNVITN